jgi:peptidoglycan/LPS O-acetylase OafA/YrhL
MIAVTTTAVLLSVRLNALPVAILGLVGGFLTPVLLSTGVDNEVGLFTYVALLDTGVLAVGYFKRWRSLDFLSFAGTVAMTLGWAFQFFSPDKVWTTLFFLSVFFLLYALLPIFHNVLRNRPSRWFDVSLAIANATLYFGASYLMLVQTGFDHATPATQAFLLATFFAGLFYTTWRWNSDDRLLRYNYLGAAATFLSVAVSIQLELHWVTIAWAIEALMLTWVGLRLRETGARHAALGVFCAAVVHWFVWDMPVFALNVDPSFVPLLNRRALSCAVLVAAIACAAWLYRRATDIDEDERSTVKTLFLLTGNAVALTLLSVDINDYFTARLSGSSPEQTNLLAQIENSRQFSISILWTLYAATMLALGLLRRSRLLRWGGIVLLAAAIGKVVVIDSTYYAASWHFPVFNQTFMTYALVVAVLAFAARLYRRPASADESERRLMLPALLLGANVLALAALSLEVIGYYDRWLTTAGLAGQGLVIISQLHEGRIFTLMLVWTLYATSAFLFGAWRRSQAWRYGGLLLLAVTTPLVLLSLSFYDASWHALAFNRTLASFAIFIVVLWLIVRTYARSGDAFEEADIARPVATVAANVLAIVALSAQAAGYFDAKIFAELSRTAAAATGVNVFEGQRNLELAKQLSLSVVWALYAVGLLIAGRVRRLLRVMGLALLSLTTLKVFLIDLSSLERAYRIISFIMLGAILLVVSYFYQRSQQRANAPES